MIVYVDMDGVLCDFEGRVEQLTGRKFSDLSREEIWKAISDDPFFYRDMPWTPNGYQLWVSICMHGIKPWILSASSSHVIMSTNHKYIWCTERLDIDVAKIIVVPHKSDKAKLAKGNYLIDDNETNISQWQAAGGYGFLYRGENDPVMKDLMKIWIPSQF